MLPTLRSDPLEIEGFVRLIFKNARFGFVQLRCFRQVDQAAVLYPWQAVEVTETETLIAKAIAVATRAANQTPAAMFAPPVVTLDNPKTAKVANIAEGLCVRVECDANPVEAAKALRAILGTPTLIVCSGGVWTHDDGHTEDNAISIGGSPSRPEPPNNTRGCGKPAASPASSSALTPRRFRRFIHCDGRGVGIVKPNPAWRGSRKLKTSRSTSMMH